MSDLLDEIKNKLNKMLDNNLNICQHYSSIVIIMYKTIFTYLNGKVDLDCFRDVLNELIDYVMKEYYSFAKLLSYDKNTLMSKIDVHNMVMLISMNILIKFYIIVLLKM